MSLAILNKLKNLVNVVVYKIVITSYFTEISFINCM